MSTEIQGALQRLSGTNLDAQGAAVALGSQYPDGLFQALASGVNPVTTGIETLPRETASGSSTLSTGVMRLAFFTARKSQLTANVVTAPITAAGATPTLIRFGIYSVAANGDLALIGSTPNDTSLLAVVGTLYTKALSAPVSMTQGVRYAFGGLAVTGATAPALYGGPLLAASLTALSPRMGAALTGLADLPASVSNASLIGNTNIPLAILTP